jgi:4-amino-4-deoxy-L-arabinose transferase-like glycosyltransferase
MFIIIPIGCYIELFVAIVLLLPAMPWQRAVIWASLIWGIILATLTEILSVFQALTYTGLLLSWSLVLFLILVSAGILYNYQNVKGQVINDDLNWPGFFGDSLARLRSLRSPRSWNPLVISFAVALGMIALVALIGVIAPPNNWDSMTYHMARVTFWLEHRSVAPYPTDVMRQLYETPWAELCIAHFYLLSGGDRFAALVQWTAMLGSLIGVSLIVRQLGANRHGQVFAVIFTATLPMGILQASSTQNDYVVTFWMVCLVQFLLVFREQPHVWNSIGIGASLGLALLTKATAYVYALPFLILFLIWAWRRMRWRLWEAVVVVGSIPLALNIGYFLRNIMTFQTLFGPPSEVDRYANASFTPATLVSNVLRDLAVQVGTPWDRSNLAIDRGLRALFSLLHLDINDPGSSWQTFQFKALSFHEDYAGNPLHLLVIGSVILLCLTTFKLRSDRLLMVYSVAIIAVFLVFALYLKWQPWHSRLELVLFVLFAPVCGVVLSRLSPRLGLNMIALGLTLAAVPWVLQNQSRPIIGPNSILTTPRSMQYFANRVAIEKSYLATANYLQQGHCASVGLVDNIDDWEYPLLVLANGGSQHVYFEHVLVANDTAHLADNEPYSSFQPCALVVIGQQRGANVQYHDVTYTMKWTSSPLTIYQRP